MPPVLFVDSNVLIEALLIPESAAFVVAEMAAQGAFDMATCRDCISDTERAILAKLSQHPAEATEVINRWEQLKTALRLKILPESDITIVLATRDKFLGIMRHKADIPVLAAALLMTPAPYAILSSNRKHFNNEVSARSGIRIFSCDEFLESIFL